MAISEPLGAVAASVEQLVWRHDASGFLCGPEPSRKPGTDCDNEPVCELFRFYRHVWLPVIVSKCFGRIFDGLRLAADSTPRSSACHQLTIANDEASPNQNERDSIGVLS